MFKMVAVQLFCRAGAGLPDRMNCCTVSCEQTVKSVSQWQSVDNEKLHANLTISTKSWNMREI